MAVDRTNPMEVFQREAPDVAKAFHGLIEAIQRLDGLDQKTKQLLYIGIRASEGDVAAVASHVPMAKLCGATRAEIRDTILMTLMVTGIKGVAHCLPVALEAYDHAGGGAVKDRYAHIVECTCYLARSLEMMRQVPSFLER